ncbi:Dynein light chain LC6, flagellar outer arm [Linum grandiflorum]
MATNNRRILAASQPEPKHQSSSAMDPTSHLQSSKVHHHHTKTINQDPPPPRPSSSFMSNYLSSKLLNPPSSKTPPSKDSHLQQAKSMTVSADFDSSSRFAAARARYYAQQQKAAAGDGKLEKESLKRVVGIGKQEALYKGGLKKSPSLNLDLVVEEKMKVLVLNETKKTHNRKKNAKNKYDADDDDVGKEMKVKKKEDVLLLEGLDIKRVSLSGGGGDGRRRSLTGSSQVELVDFLASNGAKIVSVDMPPFMQIHAIDCARKTCDSLEKFAAKTLALTLKKEFDGVYGPAWHCIVGTSFGSFVTHSVGGFLYFSMDSKLYVLLFKTTVQRAAD